MADEFAAQKDKIRDTAKWMATAYAALGAVALAGAPFSSIGQLPNDKLAIVCAAGGVSIACSLLATAKILRVLIGDYCFLDQLDFDTTRFINSHAIQILPPPCQTLQDFIDYQIKLRALSTGLSSRLESERATLSKAGLEALSAQYVEVLKRGEEASAHAARIVGLAHLYRLRGNLEAIRVCLQALAIVGLIGLGLAIVVATSVKPARPQAEMRLDRQTPLAQLAPVIWS